MSSYKCVFSLTKSILYKGITKLKLVSKDCVSLPVGFMVFSVIFFKDHLFQLESHKFERGRGRCPFDPSSSFTSILIGNDLYVTSFTVLSICHSEYLFSTPKCCQPSIAIFHMSDLILMVLPTLILHSRQH